MASYAQSNYGFICPVTNGMGMQMGMAENCRQAAQNQENKGAWMIPNGLTQNLSQWTQQNGQMLASDFQRPAFTNGRKRSRENVFSQQCEELKKAKTETGSQFNQMPMEQMFCNAAIQNGAYSQPAPSIYHQGYYHQQNPTSCFPSSMVEHQSMMYAERDYDVSLLTTLVSEVHGC